MLMIKNSSIKAISVKSSKLTQETVTNVLQENIPFKMALRCAYHVQKLVLMNVQVQVL